MMLLSKVINYGVMFLDVFKLNAFEHEVVHADERGVTICGGILVNTSENRGGEPKFSFRFVEKDVEG